MQALQNQCYLIHPGVIVTLIISKYWFPELTTNQYTLWFRLDYRLLQPDLTWP